MSNIIMSEEFMAKAKAAKSFEELKSLVAAEGVEVADEELMAKWKEISGGAKKFKLSEDELDNVAGGCGDDGPTYNGHPKRSSTWGKCSDYSYVMRWGAWDPLPKDCCGSCKYADRIPEGEITADGLDMYCTN